MNPTLTSTPAAPAAGDIQFWSPVSRTFTSSRDALESASRIVAHHLQGTRTQALSVRVAPVLPGQVVLRADADSGMSEVLAGMCGDWIEPGTGSVLRAMRYGYLHLEKSALSVRSPLVVSADHMQAVWVDLGAGPCGLTRAMMDVWLKDAGVARGLDDEAIGALVDGLQQEGQSHVIASGRAPLTGDVHMLVDPRRRQPACSDDGVYLLDSSPSTLVAMGDVLARWRPPQEGYDIYGCLLQPEVDALMAGANIRLGTDADGPCWHAAVDGVLHQRDDRIDVLELLALKGDVATGRFDFAGEVFVDRSVRHPLHLQAEGPVTIAGVLAPASVVSSACDILVADGVSGQRTRLAAGGSLHARQIDGATVEAAGDVVLRGGAYDADLRAGGRIVAGAGSDAGKGTIIGGNAWAGAGIQAGAIGSKNNTATTVAVGIDPDQSRALERLEHGLGVCYEHILRLLQRFQMSSIDAAQIRKLIAASRGPQRRVLAHNARQLARLAQLYRDMQKRHASLRDAIGAVAADIRATVVYPGVRVRVGADHCDVHETLHEVRFHVNGNGLQPR